MTKRERQAETSKRFHHIGDVVTLTGLSADALRAWERVGLLTPQRSAGGVRQYTEDDVARIRLIARTLQRGGFSRAAVAMLLQSGDLQPDAADYAPGPARARPSLPRRMAADATAVDAGRSDRRMLAAIARISDALASGRAIEDVLEVICAETCWAFGVSDATIWLAEPFPAHRTGESATDTPPHAPSSWRRPAVNISAISFRMARTREAYCLMTSVSLPCAHSLRAVVWSSPPKTSPRARIQN